MTRNKLSLKGIKDITSVLRRIQSLASATELALVSNNILEATHYGADLLHASQFFKSECIRVGLLQDPNNEA